jgi:hypothetical protein
MAILAKLFRSAILASIAACGDHTAPVGPDGGGEMGQDFGYVGSGGYGRSDGGRLSADDGGTGVRDGGTATGDGGVLDRDGGVEPPGDGGERDSASSFDAGIALDGGTGVGIVVNTPSGFFVFLDWSVSGPQGSYLGRVYFGDAHSIEFVVGGIQAGNGYTVTLTGTDPSGQSCSGTSAPFQVVAGAVSAAAVLITCPPPVVPASVTTGGVSVDAGVVISDI